MKIFILENCPHCNNARRWIGELCDENPAYTMIDIEYIDEQKEARLADSYDYYYVPAIFHGTDKLHEGIASKEKIKDIFDAYKK